MDVNERDLLTFAIIAGLWLRDRRPPAVREALNISRECNAYTSAPLFERSLRRLVNEGWLVIREVTNSRGAKVNRYVPTLRGLAEYATEIEDVLLNYAIDLASRSEDTSQTSHTSEFLESLECIEKHVPEVEKAEEMGNALATLIDVVGVYAMAGTDGGVATQDVSLPPQYEKLAQMVLDGQPADAVEVETLEQLPSQLPTLRCVLLAVKMSDIVDTLLISVEDACRRGLVAHLADVLKSALETYLKLAQYCAHLGAQFNTKTVESLLRNITSVTRCSDT